MLLRLHKDKHRRILPPYPDDATTVSHRTNEFLTVFNCTSPHIQNRRANSSSDQWLKPLIMERGSGAWSQARLIHASPGSHLGNVNLTFSPDEYTDRPTHQYPRPFASCHGRDPPRTRSREIPMTGPDLKNYRPTDPSVPSALWILPWARPRLGPGPVNYRWPGPTWGITDRPTHQYPRPSGYRHGRDTHGGTPMLKYRWGGPSLNDRDLTVTEETTDRMRDLGERAPRGESGYDNIL